MNDPNTVPITANRSLCHRSRALSHEISERNAIYLLGLLTILAVLVTVVPSSIYIRSYLQDTFGLVDGIHRTVLGQVAHRDFSTGVGIAVFAFPSLFVVLGSGLVKSLTYAASVLLILNLLVVWHLLHTRLSGTQAVLFGSLTILTLASRFVFGEDPQLVTLAMNYNRYCTAFMASLILFFIPPRHESTWTTLIDSVVIGGVMALLFYSKITFGLCALAVVILLSIVSRSNRTRALLALGYFIAVAAVLELSFGFHAPLVRDIVMALRSSGVARSSILYEIVTNLPEILICAILPAGVLLANRVLTPRLGLLFFFVSMMSIMLLNQSAQLRVMMIPFSLLIISWQIVDTRLSASAPSEARFVLISYQTVLAAACFMWISYSYPIAVNLAVSFSKSIFGKVIDGREAVLDTIKADLARGDERVVQDLMPGGSASLEIYERTISAAGLPLNEPDYVRSLLDGLGAVRAGCGSHDRVATADFVNPFPALLDMPVGGGAIYTDSGLLMSERSHVPAERFFSGIDCVMVPKLPVAYTSRNFFLIIYEGYLHQRFVTVEETAYWTVLRRTLIEQ
jgi:hypothetical protein